MERQNNFRLNLAGATISGRPDLVASRGADPHSWPWWACFGFQSDEGQVIAVSYDKNFLPSVPSGQRCWS